MFFGHSPLVLNFRGSVLGVPGEGLPGGKSGFRLGSVAKSMKICENRSKNVKIEARTPRGDKNSSPKVFFQTWSASGCFFGAFGAPEGVPKSTEN